MVFIDPVLIAPGIFAVGVGAVALNEDGQRVTHIIRAVGVAGDHHGLDTAPLQNKGGKTDVAPIHLYLDLFDPGGDLRGKISGIIAIAQLVRRTA